MELHFDGNYAKVGDTYNETLDAFISPKPFDSWVLNKTTFAYEPPTPIPDGGLWDLTHRWDESTTSWVELNIDTL